MSSGVRQIPFRAPVELAAVLRHRARLDGVSQANVVLDAIEATADRIPELLHAGSPSATGMFERLKAAAPAQNTVPLAIRVTTQARDAIDELVAFHEAPSRTALIVAALRAYLGVRG